MADCERHWLQTMPRLRCFLETLRQAASPWVAWASGKRGMVFVDPEELIMHATPVWLTLNNFRVHWTGWLSLKVPAKIESRMAVVDWLIDHHRSHAKKEAKSIKSQLVIARAIRKGSPFVLNGSLSFTVQYFESRPLSRKRAAVRVKGEHVNVSAEIV